MCWGAAPGVQAASFHFTPIRLPADAAMHTGSPNEWWYVTGHLRDAAGHRYGYELVTFKFGNARSLDPLLATNTLYRIDLAITDEANPGFTSTIEYLAPSPSAALSSRKLDLRMSGPTASLAFATLPGPGLAYHLSGRMAGGAVDLRVTSSRAPLLEGGKGLEHIGDGYSYYYSLTNLTTSGTLTLHGHAIPVNGLSWMDHQWGKWSWTSQKGWDWMAIQLDNGISLSLVNFLSGPRVSAKGATISFADQPQLFDHSARMIPSAPTWTSPRSHIRYPLRWRVQIPSIRLDAMVTTTVPNQEMVDQLDPFSTYWEGSSHLSGTLAGKRITGQTYTELAGYYGTTAQ